MNFALMKALAINFSTFLLAGVILGSSASAAAPCGRPSGTSGDLEIQGGYPTFCSIPAAPKDVRSPAQFRSSVVESRRAGRDLVRTSGPETFVLPPSGASGFAKQARADAEPPPPMNPQSAAELEDFARTAHAAAASATHPH